LEQSRRIEAGGFEIMAKVWKVKGWELERVFGIDRK
jgi:hypothetical protein